MKKIVGIVITLLTICASCSHDDAGVIYTQVRSVNKLVLAQMTISKMATLEDVKLSEAEGVKQTAAGLLDAVKIGTRKAAYSYDTYMRAYISLDNLRPEDIELNSSNKTATIKLPAIKTEFAGRDMQFREDHYRVTGLRSEVDAEERAKLKEQMNETLKKEVEEKPEFKEMLIESATAKGRKFFENIFEANGYKVVVEFKD